MIHDHHEASEALAAAVARHLGAITTAWWDEASARGVTLRRSTQVGWNRSTSGFVLPGGLMPSSRSEAAQAFNVVIEGRLEAIEADFKAELAERGVTGDTGDFAWLPERNTFGLAGYNFSVSQPTEENNMPDPREPKPTPGAKVADGKRVDPTGKEAVDPAVADANDLATDAEKAAQQESGGKTPG